MQMSEIYKRTSLDDKLRRLRKSKVPSKEFSLWLMRRACEKSVIKTLRGSEAETFAAMLRENFIRKFRRNPDDITFGDLAVLIAGWYLKEGDPTEDVILYMASLYFGLENNLGKIDPFSSGSRLGSSRRGITLDAKEMDHLQEWTHIPIGDYISIIMDLDMPPKSKEICTDLFVSGRYDEMTENWMLMKLVMDRKTGDTGSADDTLSAKWIMSKASQIYRRTKYSAVIDPFINYVVLPMAFLTAGGER